MSKRFAAGCDEVFDGFTPYTVTYDSFEEMGEKGVYYTLSNYNNITEQACIIQYVNMSETNEICPMVKTRTEYPDINLTIPNHIVVGQEHELKLNIPTSYAGLYIVDSLEAELPDAVFDLFNHFITDTNVFIDKFTSINTDGVLQDFVVINMYPIVIHGHSVYKTRLVIAEGCQDYEFTVDKNSRSGNIFKSRGEATACVSPNVNVKVLSKLTSKVLDIFSETVENYPHKPIIERINRNGSVFIRVTTNAPAHGNIYFNGGAEPAYTYVTGRTAPYTAEIKIDKAGAYTANVISGVFIMNQLYVAYGELSDTLIIEAQNVECTLSFNEYTGVISCVPDIEGSVEKFTLQKESGSEWIDVSENTTGEFHITEGGTYKIIPTFGIFYTGTVFPESITVITTLNTPTAYSDPAFPSQLGFDEIENANMYDIYRVNEGGEDELVATISQNNIISRIMRKEKMFIVIPNDEVKNV